MIKKINKTIQLTLFLLLTTVCINAYADIPHLINYQGKLTDSQGVPLNGSYDVTFRIYDAASGGNLLWTEEHTQAKGAPVTVTKGIFSIMLGSLINLNLAFDKPYWLAIQVGNDPEMSPRQRITSVGYAYISEGVKGSENLFPSSGNVGIGTQNPTVKLDVNGDIKVQSININGDIKTQNIAAGKNVTAFNWGSITPTNLGNAVDSNDTTATTEGVTHSAGNEGYIVVDLGTVYKGIIYVKMGARMPDGGSVGRWRVRSGLDNNQWIINWDSQDQNLGSSEVVWSPAVPFWGRYIGITAYDIGGGQVGLRVYEIYVKPYQ